MGETRVVVMMPVFNDWVACRLVLTRLDEVLSAMYRSVSVLIVDDGSDLQPTAQLFRMDSYACLEPCILRLRRNLGHQRAICVGLAYVHQTMSADVTVIMDSDGEDAPEDVPRLLDEVQASGDCIVFARRTKRSESYLFRVGYALFRILHRIATGHSVAFGNFSAVPRERLVSLMAVGDLWNNYAASVLVSRQRYRSIPTTRAKRLGGNSKMNMLSLVLHGLGAISVFGEVVAVRFTLMGLVAVVLTIGILILNVTTAFGGLSIRALIFTSMLALASVQVAGFSLLLAFITLSRRSAAVFQPARDYHIFVDRVVELVTSPYVERSSRCD